MEDFQNKDTKKSKLTLCNIILISFVLSAIGSIHSVMFNESRLIVPTDLSTYEFRFADLILGIPLTIFILSTCIASIYYPILIVNKSTFKKYKLGERTPKINNQKWILGFAGILGFIPLFTNLSTTYIDYTNIILLVFFSQFAYYFQSKFSDILVDERFLYNLALAESKAYKIAYTSVIISFILSIPRLSGNVLNIFLLSVIALSYSVSEILKSYYLYKYDMEE